MAKLSQQFIAAKLTTIKWNDIIVTGKIKTTEGRTFKKQIDSIVESCKTISIDDLKIKMENLLDEVSSDMDIYEKISELYARAF